MAEKAEVQEQPRADYDDSTGRKSDLLAAFEAVEAKSAPEPVAAKPEGVKAAAIPGPEPDAEPVEKTETPEAEVEQPAEGEPEATKVEAKDELEAPSNWSKARKEQFAEQPEGAKRFILDRHKEMEADYTRKTSEIAESRKVYGAVDEIFSPYRDQMRQAGYTPENAIRAWAQAELALSNPATRDQAFKDLASTYKFDLAKLVPDQAAVADPNDPEAAARLELEKILKPYVTPLQQRIEELSGKVTQYDQSRIGIEQQRHNEVQARVLNEIQSFANAKDATGTLAHPYFSDVENDMAFLAAGYQQMKQPVPSLEELYQKAVRGNTATFERLQAAERAAAANSANAAARTKAANAKRAGSSITGAPSNGQPLRNGADLTNASVRDNIRAAVEEHQLQ